MDRENNIPAEKQNKKFFRHLFLVGFFTSAILFAILAFLFFTEKETRLEQLASERRANIDYQKNLILDIYENAIADLKFLANQNELKSLIASGDNRVRSQIEEEYLNFIRFKTLYDQVCFVDENGQEIVHVERQPDKAFLVPHSRLENRKDLEYFQKTMALPPGAVYISPMNLTFKNGKVEFPLRPVIYFAMAVFDEESNKKGVVVLNYRGDRLIESLRESGSISNDETYLMDADGYWLCALNPENEWGSVLEERKDCNFASKFPAEWKKISRAEFSQFTNMNGMFTAKAFFPALEVFKKTEVGLPTGQHDRATYVYHWILLSHVPFEDLHKTNSILFKEFLWVGVILFFSSLIPIWLIAERMDRRKENQERLFFSATYDEVTGLLKRAPFVEKLGDTYEESLRYQRKFGILFIDLDDFKSVNDTYGHSEGDKVLKETARRLLAGIRKSDTVGRMGGDEFAVLLPVIEDTRDIEAVAGKVLKELAVPFSAGNHLIQLGASIGICYFPKHKGTPESFLKKADAAMYEAKRVGKNTFRMAD
ncbi:MAG: GGDEF domain-containing protein [Deltaproteobacteria bacterium]|nr:GGDEF domain-containing protein [Deltaproteobacteria bacterium]